MTKPQYCFYMNKKLNQSFPIKIEMYENIVIYIQLEVLYGPVVQQPTINAIIIDTTPVRRNIFFTLSK